MAVKVIRVELFERGMSILRDSLEKLNKRARRYGMDELILTVVSSEPVERVVRRYNDGRDPSTIPDCEYIVEISGCEPRINGWGLAARIEFDADLGTIVHIAPGRDDDGSYSKYRDAKNVCEHCNTNRRRNDIFVLEHDDGRRKVIGRNCLADYLRCGSAERFAAWAEFADKLKCLDPDGGGDWHEFTGGNGNPSMRLDSFLRVVSVVKRKFGWMGRAAARDSFDSVATADIAGRVIYGRGASHERWLEENDLFSNDKDAEYVDKAIEWCRDMFVGDNEYRHTINAIARAGHVNMRKYDGYAASILIAYDKHCEREIEYAEKRKGAKNKVHYGDAKKRYRNIPVKCIGLKSFDGNYGVTTMVRFEFYPDGPDGADKAVLIWWGSGDRIDDWDLDTDYDIDFTVKDHDDHERYGKQTKINRVKAREKCAN